MQNWKLQISDTHTEHTHHTIENEKQLTRHRRTDELLPSLHIYIQLFGHVGRSHWPAANHLSCFYWSTSEDVKAKNIPEHVGLFITWTTAYSVFGPKCPGITILWYHILGIRGCWCRHLISERLLSLKNLISLSLISN